MNKYSHEHDAKIAHLRQPSIIPHPLSAFFVKFFDINQRHNSCSKKFVAKKGHPKKDVPYASFLIPPF
jgi:hypothetical protein